MLSGLLRSSPRTSTLQTRERSPFSSPYEPSVSTRRGQRYERRRVDEDRDSTETSAEEEDDEEENDNGDDADESGGDEDDGSSDEDGLGESTPLLPIFSAQHLDALPVYNLTHTIRLLVVARCETTLSWVRTPKSTHRLFSLRAYTAHAYAGYDCLAGAAVPSLAKQQMPTHG
jgi:hypothetical protein